MRKHLVELKAKVDNLNQVRERLLSLGAERVGMFKQTDTYFKVNSGRLKIREIQGQDKVEIVSYVRADIAEIKKSDILVVEAQPAETTIALMKSFFPIVGVVQKSREIYLFRKTQIHLDNVTGLGEFVEFERPTPPEPDLINESNKVLVQLCQDLGINKEDLQAPSYIDLIQHTH